ncbi:MAG TPA: DUF2071 domain-containing protein [Acidobacteriaceae bacterium]|jgi:uncharacterized protein YqjF (DUF2071 family)|nr:DUF2071 domain-containing protein [Acidobacteriaceae bacterium]
MFTFLTAEWRKLIMAQYEVPPELLLSHLPYGVELDLFQPTPSASPRCFVSLVGFLFDRVRIFGLSVPLHTSFEEVNLRFYVRRTLPDGTFRRGVVFLSEIVASPAITLIARGLYGEPYTTAPTDHLWARSAENPDHVEITYSWKHHRLWQSLAVRALDRPQPMPPGSLEEFITEHYWGYTRRPDGSTAEYGVEHPRWQLFPILQHRIACDFASLYGPDFASLTGRPPVHLLLAEGSPVRIRWGEVLPLPTHEN